MGFSGMKGQIFLLDAQCPSKLDGTPPSPLTNKAIWPDEVTKFTMSERAQSRKYGHDKSFGFQDTCSGIRSVDVTLDAMARIMANSSTGYHAGMVVWLYLYPFGHSETSTACNAAALSGYFMVDQVTTNVDIETGAPISYTMTLSSKGYINGLAGPNENFNDPEWGGFECDCTLENGSTDVPGVFSPGNEV